MSDTLCFTLGSDVEGEVTAHYLADFLRHHPCRMSRIAQCLPAGGVII